MKLPQLHLQHSYRTGRGDMVMGFFVPCLEQSILYRRAAGYFTSHGLALAAKGVASLVSRGGQMRLVVSPHLEPDDIAALQGAMDQPQDLLRSIASKSLADVEDALVRDRLNALAWLAAAGFLQIRLAVRVDGDGAVARGIYHEKVGIFSDADGNHVAFTGSANETAGGLVENFESLEVFRSWNDPDGRVPDKIADFEALWSDSTPGLRTFDFSLAGAELLAAFRDPANPPPGLPPHLLNDLPVPGEFRPPRGFELRDYQTAAGREWSRRGGKGILAMATGSGKTLTALVLASSVAEKNHPLVLIVTCPFINLCKQWLREMAAFGLSPVPCIQAIIDYFGGVIFEYPIARAIADGRLCQYRYHPHLVTLIDGERGPHRPRPVQLQRRPGEWRPLHREKIPLSQNRLRRRLATRPYRTPAAEPGQRSHRRRPP